MKTINFDALSNLDIQEAKRLLKLKIGSRLGNENGQLCYRAVAGETVLPVTSNSRIGAIKDAISWLEKIASQEPIQRSTNTLQ